MIAKVLLVVIGAYQRVVSPFLPRACRFWPTCSEYAALAVERHGAVRGLWLAARRLVRCQPFNPGGVDYPPERVA